MSLKFIPTFLILCVAAFLISCATHESKSAKTEILQFPKGKTAAISITYDDATINQFRQALPIMDTLGMKGTFFINTADIPGSEFPPKYFGRPLQDIVRESAGTPTVKENLFERASALRFLNIENAVESHNSAGSLFEQGKVDEACKVIDEALSRARKVKQIKETRPVLLTGEVITWDEIKKFAANGHEFGNHTISHPRLAVLTEENMLYELEKCKEEIANQLGAPHTFSAECPFGTENERVMEYAYKIHPALRNRMPEDFLVELNRWHADPPGKYASRPYVQWQRGPLKRHSVPEMKSWVDTLLKHANVWLVLTFHGVDGVGWEAKPHEELKEYFSYMKQHEEKIWVGTFGDLTKYIRERMRSEVKQSIKDDVVTVTLTHGLDKQYDVPLTLKTYVDKSWKNIKVKQGDAEVSVQTGSDAEGSFVIYDARPNSDPIEISEL